MHPWRTRSRRTLLDLGKYLSVETHAVELPDGRVIDEWPWLITPDYVNVLLVNEVGLYLIFRQTKYAVAGTTLAPVGGYLEPGEDPLEAAKRETLEETGHEAPDWVDLGHFAVDGNRGAGVGYLYLARDARKIADINADDLEEQELLFLTRDELQIALLAGEFKVMSWATVVALALLHE